MSTEGNGVYYSCCDCEDVCECTVVTPEPEMETDDSPFPEYITNYVLSRKPIITLYNVDEDEYDDEFPYNTLTTHDDQARELVIEPSTQMFYDDAFAYICSVYNCDPEENLGCVIWESQVDVEHH
jgi:hypothetical protein